MSSEGSDSARIQVLSRMIADQRLGKLQALESYLTSAPGQEEAVARSYVRLKDSTDLEQGGDLEGRADGEPAERVGPYELIHELGRGGQAVVWLARDHRLGRQVALKVVRDVPGVGSAPRFRREAIVGARLEHPALCSVLDIGTEAGLSWIAMQYVKGINLSAWANTERPLDDILRLFEELARALEIAHAAGIVHRDVKPSNVLVTPEDKPVLVDFGVAWEEKEGPELTRTGDALGTPAYMAPEQIRGEVSRLDGRVDVWSLGVTLYECLTQERPFQGPTREALVQTILEGAFAPLRRNRSHLPSDLETVLATAMSPDRDERYRTAIDFAEDLRRVREHEPIMARAAGPLLRLQRWSRRNRALALTVLLLFLSLLGGLATSLGLLGKTRAALGEKSELLEDVTDLVAEVTRLSDRDVASALLDEEAQLWPAQPQLVGTMETWLGRAGEVLARRDDHQLARATFVERIASTSDQESKIQVEKAGVGLNPGRFDDATGSWLLSLVDSHLEDLDRLEEQRERIAERLDAASNLRERTIDEYAEEWAAVCKSVNEDGIYENLQLTPQVGLIPLGPDPYSGLQEFAQFGTGEIPERDSGSGELSPTADSALVFVLVPGGEAQCGSMLPSSSNPIGDPFVDPDGLYQEGPRHSLRLDPFFLSKYEMTQGQWFRHTGEKPSRHTMKSTMDKSLTAEMVLRLPVEMVNWHDCTRVLGELGLILPTESQWEYAARADTDTIWWFGNDRRELQGRENLGDLSAKRAVGPQGKNYEDFYEDGWVGSSPVGTYEANYWGFHDVSGNVWEWCRNTLEDWHFVLPEDGEGEITGVQENVAIRGSAFSGSSYVARMSYRVPEKKDARQYSGGVRPARRLVP